MATPQNQQALKCNIGEYLALLGRNKGGIVTAVRTTAVPTCYSKEY